MNTTTAPKVNSYSCVYKISDNAFKKKPVKTIMAISVGATDLSGNKITSVLVKHNEFAIYEIDTPDINNRIRTIIDGYTDESEIKIQDRFNKVKQNYIQATGLLSNSLNTEVLKRRIAHTLSTCLSGTEVDGNTEFENLIKTIKEEHEKLVRNRTLYIFPVLLSILIFLVLSLYFLNIYKMDEINKVEVLYFSCLFLAVSIGAGISILINATKLNFQEYLSRFHYFLLGLERLFLAISAGVVTFISVKAGLLFPNLTTNSIWGVMVVLILAGFSESFIPGFLTKIESSNSK